MPSSDLPIECWLVMLYHYEMWCYDLGWLAIEQHNRQLEDYWEHF